MQTQYNDLKSRLTEINDIESACSVLNWDQSTFIPEAANPARSRQLATLGKLAHEKSIDPSLGKLIDDLQDWSQTKDHSSEEAALVRLAKRDFERSAKVSTDFTHEYAEHTGATYAAWTKARAANDFKSMVPYLEKTLEFSKRYADFFPGYDHIADPLIDEADFGVKAKDMKNLFADLKAELVPLAQKIYDQPAPDTSCIEKNCDETQQVAFSEELAKKIGFDFNRGRQDKTFHPFMTRFAADDIRILTRTKPNDITECLFSSIHEAGHGMYEQGISRSFDGLPLGNGTSAGVHESQSRLGKTLLEDLVDFGKSTSLQCKNLFQEPLITSMWILFTKPSTKLKKASSVPMLMK